MADMCAALQAYERLRRGRVDRVNAWGARIAHAKTVGPLGRAVRDLVLPHILARAATPKAIAKQAWLFDHHIAPRAPTPIER